MCIRDRWYIVQDPSFLMEHTDEPVFYDAELGLYVWGITHFLSLIHI